MRPPTPAPAYANLYMVLTEIARDCGYALAIHGTLQRDFDLIAVPWVDDALEPKALVDRICDSCNGWWADLPQYPDPTEKPHGRLAWTIHLDAPAFIDLSVMPRQAS